MYSPQHIIALIFMRINGRLSRRPPAPFGWPSSSRISERFRTSPLVMTVAAAVETANILSSVSTGSWRRRRLTAGCDLVHFSDLL